MAHVSIAPATDPETVNRILNDPRIRGALGAPEAQVPDAGEWLDKLTVVELRSDGIARGLIFFAPFGADVEAHAAVLPEAQGLEFLAAIPLLIHFARTVLHAGLIIAKPQYDRHRQLLEKLGFISLGDNRYALEVNHGSNPIHT